MQRDSPQICERGIHILNFLLKIGTVVSGTAAKMLDVMIEGEMILKVGEYLSPPEAQLQDVSGKLLFPGFIDGHTLFALSYAGSVTADDFESGTRAAF